MTRSMTAGILAQARVVGQLWRFASIAVVCGVLDFATYHGLQALGMDSGVLIDFARATSFLVGTTVAYLLNKHFTFAATGGVKQFSSFGLLYGAAFFVVVGLNRLMLLILPDIPGESSIAWAISQGVASLVNFVMLKVVVFREADQASKERV